MEPTRSQELTDFLNGINPVLNDLWKTLCKNQFLYQEGPYPAGHGKDHITNVLLNLKKFFSSCKADFPPQAQSITLAAAMIHDINMIPLRSQGSESPKAHKARSDHALISRIKELADAILFASGFTKKNQRENIIQIASAHARDTEKRLQDKMRQLGKRESDTGFDFLKRSAVLVQASDFFDIGPDRLARDVSCQKWNADQIDHYKKHATVCLNILEETQCIKLWLNNEDHIKVNGNKISISPMEKYKTIYTVNAQACHIVSKLNSALGTRWRVEFDKTILGELSPMGRGINLFTHTLATALNEWPDDEGPFPVDLMGHSLYGRFVDDGEALNEQLLELLSSSGMNLRLILLDPSVENQQMCEIYDGQRTAVQEENRSILPRYTRDKKIDAKGDILSSLGVLNEWLTQKVGLRSSMEIRATTRMMYMSLTRFGNTIIVTPYRQKGLFNDSISIVFKNNENNSPLYKAYEDAFTNIWEDRFETRLMGYKNSYDTRINPLNFLVPDNESKAVKPFDYERFFLTEYQDRIKAVFDIVRKESRQIIPPIEVEIQPSEECTLTCEHCIGRHINQKKQMGSKENKDFTGLLDYRSGGYEIERFRLSGLIGDPLSDSSREAALAFIEQARKKDRTIVLLTNGVGLTPDDPRLLMADYIHVSLDAATPETYESIKGADCLDQIEQHIMTLCQKKNNRGHPEPATRIGIGFVVTQRNFFEVSEAISRAKALGVDFIRFKPDIRGMQAIAWRNWQEAFTTIKQHQAAEKETGRLDIILTETGASHHGVPLASRCWSQYFYTTIGADNQIYPCDHLTTTEPATMGDGGNFQTDWAKAVSKDIIGRRHRQCMMCPPLSRRLNRLIDQLYSLYENQLFNWDTISQWIEAALDHGSSPPPGERP